MSEPPSESPPDIRVVVVDDHLMVRKGVELLLRSADLAVVGVAERAAEALPLIRRRRPDVAVVDIGLADGSGIALSRRIREEVPDTATLLYTGTVDASVLGEALAADPAGVALKAGSPTELVDAVRLIARGGTYFDPRLTALLAPRQAAPPVLSPREREIFGLLARGLTGEQIAELLVLSPETIRTHVRNAMRKLEANTRVHALALALQSGEVKPEQLPGSG